MIHNEISPDEFLTYVHDIDLTFMKEDKIMRNELEPFDMDKFIFTNGSADHAANILTHLESTIYLGEKKVFDIKDAGYVPKPEAETFDLMVKNLVSTQKRLFMSRI